MHNLSLWTAAAVLAFGLAACGDSVESSGSGAGGSGGDATTSGGTMSSSSTAGSGGMGSGGSSMAGTGTMSGSGGSGGGSCTPKTTDPSEIGIDCEATMQCSPGYTCQPFNGFIMQFKCEILCNADCECPDGIQCVTVSDKGHTWTQCGP